MSDRLAYDLGVYVQTLRQEVDEIRRLLRENDPWPPNVGPNGDWHKGKRAQIEDAIRELEHLIPRDAS